MENECCPDSQVGNTVAWSAQARVLSPRSAPPLGWVEALLCRVTISTACGKEEPRKGWWSHVSSTQIATKSCFLGQMQEQAGLHRRQVPFHALCQCSFMPKHVTQILTPGAAHIFPGMSFPVHRLLAHAEAIVELEARPLTRKELLVFCFYLWESLVFKGLMPWGVNREEQTGHYW